MNLRRLALHRYRNIGEADIEPDPGFNVFWGNNAQGKTNLLEGIFLLGTLKSFRGARNPELIREGDVNSRLSAGIDRRGVLRRVELEIEPQGKRARVDGKELRSAVEFFGCLNPVLFSPEEVGIARGAPAERRAMIDRALFQSDVAYLDRVREYDRNLRQRNRLLRDGRPTREVDPWTEGVVRSGARLRFDRYGYLKRIAPRLGEAYRNISGGREEAELTYRQGGEDFSSLQSALRAELEREADRERRLGQTMSGPHRDDPLFLIDGRPVRLFASQGQQRSFLLAFKTAQIMDLEEHTGEPPVLLLDDMTSELDRHRQGFFFRFLLERRGQVFLTTTEARPLIEQGFRNARFFRVEGGTLRQDCVE